jgi:hypothetical protein
MTETTIMMRFITVYVTGCFLFHSTAAAASRKFTSASIQVSREEDGLHKGHWDCFTSSIVYIGRKIFPRDPYLLTEQSQPKYCGGQRVKSIRDLGGKLSHRTSL